MIKRVFSAITALAVFICALSVSAFAEGYTELADVAISKILKFDLLADDGIIVHERCASKLSKFAQKVSDSRKYGTVAVDFLKK